MGKRAKGGGQITHSLQQDHHYPAIQMSKKETSTNLCSEMIPRFVQVHLFFPNSTKADIYSRSAMKRRKGAKILKYQGGEELWLNCLTETKETECQDERRYRKKHLYVHWSCKTAVRLNLYIKNVILHMHLVETPILSNFLLPGLSASCMGGVTEPGSRTRMLAHLQPSSWFKDAVWV